MKKILLIGKTGQLGGELIKDASAFDFELIGLNRSDLDITNEAQMAEKITEIKPDILINTAAFHVVPKCETEPAAAMAVNFVAVDKLARLCRHHNIKFITYSTDYVFDGEKGSPYEETDSPRPLQVYGISKLAGEYAALNIYPEGVFVIRTNGLYGGATGSPDKGGNFVLNIIKEAKGKNIIEVSSEQIISPTYAGDLSQATLKLLNSQAKPGVYHLVNEGQCSWAEFTQAIFKLAKVKTEVKPVDRGGASGSMKRPKFSVLKNTKAKALGIELSSWQAGLKTYFNFLNNYQDESKN